MTCPRLSHPPPPDLAPRSHRLGDAIAASAPVAVHLTAAMVRGGVCLLGWYPDGAPILDGPTAACAEFGIRHSLAVQDFAADFFRLWMALGESGIGCPDELSQYWIAGN